MPKCIVCGYSSRKKIDFFRCWNPETKTGCKRYTCNNCIFIIRETTGYSNFVCPNTFCNEEHEAELFVGLKKWYEPDGKLQYEEKVKLLKEREKEVEKLVKKWEDKISSATKRMVFTSQKTFEQKQFMKHEFKQLDFHFWSGRNREEQWFYPLDNQRKAFLTSVAFATRSNLLKFKPRLRLRSNGTDILDLALTGDSQVFTLNHPLATSGNISAEIELMESYYDYSDRHESLDATLTLELVGGN